MAKTRRVARRHRRWRQKENREKRLAKLRKIENQISPLALYIVQTSPFWKVLGPYGEIKVPDGCVHPAVFTPHHAGGYIVTVNMETE